MQIALFLIEKLFLAFGEFRDLKPRYFFGFHGRSALLEGSKVYIACMPLFLCVDRMVEKVPAWIERLLMPKLSSLEGELKAFRGEVAGEFKAVSERFRAMDERIDSLEKQMASMRSEMNDKFASLRNEMNDKFASLRNEMNDKFASLRSEMNARFESLESKLTLIEDVTRLKIEVKALSEKVAAITRS